MASCLRAAGGEIPEGRDFYAQLLEQLDEGIYLVDGNRRITFWNAAAERLTGYGRAEVLGSCCAQSVLRHVDHAGMSTCPQACPLQQSLRGESCPETELFMRHKDGHRIPVRVRVIPTYDSSGARSGAAELFRLNSPAEQLERRLADLERLALLDPLTALPNRRYLEAQLANRLDELCRYSWPFGLAFLDVDQFKRVNDVHGHQVGDEVLRMVGKTLSAGTRTFDAVGRWAGDEFLAVLANVQQRELEEVAERFRALVSSAGLGAGVGIQVTVSIGVTLASREDSIETLVQRADRLMYEAKRAGRNRVCV